jgi:spore coat protein U-like protein
MTGQYLHGTLGYSLFSNSGMTTNWGQTVGVDTVAGTGTGVAQPLTVYGQIPTGTAPAADGYFDTITATVTY